VDTRLACELVVGERSDPQISHPLHIIRFKNCFRRLQTDRRHNKGLSCTATSKYLKTGNLTFQQHWQGKKSLVLFIQIRSHVVRTMALEGFHEPDIFILQHNIHDNELISLCQNINSRI